MESNDLNLKHIKEFELYKKISEEQKASSAEFIVGAGNLLKAAGKFGQQNKEIKEQNLLKYSNEIQTKIKDLNDVTEKCQFLREEKRKYGAMVIEANIKGNGYDFKKNQAIIDKIIEPLLKDWESELESKMRNPLANLLVPYVNAMKQKTIENIHPTEIIKTNQIPAIVKINSEIIQTESKLPSGFMQIKCEATKKEILNYFMILSKEKNNWNDKVYMEEKDIKEFLEKNFLIFDSRPTGKYFPINLNKRQKIRLRNFTYQFYNKYEPKTGADKMKYVMLLINNFELFKNDKPKILSSNMGSTKRSVEKNVIPISKYL